MDSAGNQWTAPRRQSRDAMTMMATAMDLRQESRRPGLDIIAASLHSFIADFVC